MEKIKPALYLFRMLLKHVLPVSLLSMLCNIVAAQQFRLMIPKGHTASIESLHFSNDGKLIASSSEDGTIKIWDVQTGYLLADIKVGPIVFDVVFSPDKTKVLGTIVGGVKVWDLNGNLLCDLPTDSINYDEVYFVANGKKILTSSKGRTALWDAATGKELQVLFDDTENAHYRETAGSISHNNNLFARLSESDALQVWDLVSGELLNDGSISSADRKIAWSANDSLLVTEYMDHVMVSDAFTGQLKAKLGTDSVSYYQDMTISYSGKYCAATYHSEDDSTRLVVWNVEQGEEMIRVIAGDYNTSLLFSDDEQVLLSKSDEAVQAFDLASGKKRYTISPSGKDDAFRNIVFDMKAKRLVTVGNSYDSVFLWNIANGKMIKGLKLQSAFNIAFSSDGSMFAAGLNQLYGAAISLFIAETGLEYNYLWGSSGGVFDLAFSPDNTKAIAITGSEDVHIRNLLTGRIEKTLYHPAMVSYAGFSKKGGLIFTKMDGMVTIWDSAGNYKYSITVSKGLHSAALSDDGKKILLAFQDDMLIVDVSNPSKQKKYTYPSAVKNEAYFSPDRSYIAILQHNPKNTGYLGIETSFMVINAVTGKTVLLPFSKETSGMGKEIGIRWVKFSPDSKLVAVCDYQKVEVFDLASARKLYRLRYEKSIRDIFFSRNKKMLLVLCDGMNEVLITDDQTGKLICKLKGHEAAVSFTTTNKENTRIITGSVDNCMRLWDAASFTLLGTMRWNGQTLTTGSFIDSTLFVGNTSDNSLSLWQTGTGSKLADIHALDDDLMYLDTSGYYMTSSGVANKMYYVTPDLNVVLFDQLDVKFNRPDIVLRSLGNSDTGLLKSYHHAYLKRLKRLGIESSAVTGPIPVPVLQAVNKSQIVFEQKNEWLELKVKAYDSISVLQKFNVWVNDVPLFGIKGISLANRRSHRYDTAVTIRLSAGENRIEASVNNAAGFESYREPVFVQYIPPKPIETKTHFIGIGINEFTQPGHDLNWSVKDIRDLAGKLKIRNKDLLVDTLFNSDVTKENILNLKTKIEQLGINDRLVIAYSGHGLLSNEKDYYLSTYDIDFEKPEERGLSYEDFEGLLDKIAVRKKLVLIDACHSGELDKEEMHKIETQSKVLDSLGTKVSIVNKSSVVIKKKLGVTSTFDLMQTLFANVGKGTGATVIAAAGGMQYAQENATLQNGVFTYCILRAFEGNSRLTVSQLKKIVSGNVDMLTNGLQKPTSRNKTNLYDWIVW